MSDDPGATRRPGSGRWAVAAALLILATPPHVVPGAGWLVLPALMAFRLLADTGIGLRWSYLLGVAHLLVVSWSVRHVLWPAPFAIALVGGLYYLGVTALTRALRRWQTPVAFGLAVAAAFWLRAVMPEIPYPHGQPCHALWRQPWALGAVRWGGEPLANGLLAAVAAAAVDGIRCWRHPALRSGALRRLAAVCAGLAAASALPPPAPTEEGPRPELHVVAIEPGFGPAFQWQPDFPRLFVERLARPTLSVAAPEAGDEAPDLVLWPESTFPGALVPAGDGLEWRTSLREPLRLASRTRLLVGAERLHQEGAPGGVPITPAAILLDHRGRFLDHQEKLALVPAGEFLPLVSWLPESWRRALEEWVRGAMGSLPLARPGVLRPPLATGAGVRIGTLHCFDNAFSGPSREQVALGARLLCVLSNEAWYQGGGELAQLAAMTVVRALETGTPLVRCTVDGWTLAVDGRGRILAQLPWEPLPRDRARTLPVFVAGGPGRLGPLAWVLPAVPWLVLLLIAVGLLHAAAAWARLRAVRPTGQDGPEDLLGSTRRPGGS